MQADLVDSSIDSCDEQPSAGLRFACHAPVSLVRESPEPAERDRIEYRMGEVVHELVRAGSSSWIRNRERSKPDWETVRQRIRRV
jgi:hypothetical protein